MSSWFTFVRPAIGWLASPKQRTELCRTDRPRGCRGSALPLLWTRRGGEDAATCRGRTPLQRLAALDSSSATGQLRLLSYIPDRSKQQGRRLPPASIEQAFLIRRARVSACLAETIQ